MKNLFAFLYILLAAALAVSCDKSVDLAADGTPADHVEFKLAISATTLGDHESAEASAMENYIDLSTLRILLFNSEGQYVADFEFDPEEIRHEEGEPVYITGEMSAEHVQLLADRSASIVVLANWPQPLGDIAAGTAITSIFNDANSVFSMQMADEATEATYQPTTEHPIPMYGCKTITNFRPSHLTDLGSIDLLRAMSKIRVDFDIKEQQGITVNEVLVEHYPAKGWCTPAALLTDMREVCEDETALFRPFCETDNALAADTDVLQNIRLRSLTVDNEDGAQLPSYQCYIPEYRNRAADGNVLATATALVVKYTELEPENPDAIAQDRESRIYFMDYSAKPATPRSDQNILRNRLYHFVVTAVESDLVLKYTVCPWEERESGDIIFH